MIEFYDAMLDVSWKNWEFQCNRFRDVDTKAVGIITITGILITFLSKAGTSSRLSETLYFAASMSFLVTILLCVGAIMTRKYEAISSYNLLEELSGEDKEKQIKRLIGTIADKEEKLCKKSNTKAAILRCAIITLGFSILFLIFYSISVFV